MSSRVYALSLALIAAVSACAARDEATAGGGAVPLAGTSWQLVVAVRLDCNRGRGPWKSSGPNQLELGPLALTRAFCGQASLHDQIVKQWGNIRSYVVRDGHLFLSLMADGGIYEFEPSP